MDGGHQNKTEMEVFHIITDRLNNKPSKILLIESCLECSFDNVSLLSFPNTKSNYLPIRLALFVCKYLSIIKELSRSNRTRFLSHVQGNHHPTVYRLPSLLNQLGAVLAVLSRLCQPQQWQGSRNRCHGEKTIYLSCSKRQNKHQDSRGNQHALSLIFGQWQHWMTLIPSIQNAKRIELPIPRPMTLKEMSTVHLQRLWNKTTFVDPVLAITIADIPVVLGRFLHGDSPLLDVALHPPYSTSSRRSQRYSTSCPCKRCTTECWRVKGEGWRVKDEGLIQCYDCDISTVSYIFCFRQRWFLHPCHHCSHLNGKGVCLCCCFWVYCL